MGAQKPFDGLRLRLGSCWEEWKRKVFPWRRVIWFALQTNQWFLTYIRPPNIWLLTTFLIKREIFHNVYEKNWQKCKTILVITYLFEYSLLVGAIACYYHKQEDVLDFIQKLKLRYNFGNKNSWRVSQKNRPPIQRAVRNCVKDLSQIELEETVLHDLIILHAMIAVTTVQTKTV